MEEMTPSLKREERVEEIYGTPVKEACLAVQAFKVQWRQQMRINSATSEGIIAAMSTF